MSLQKNIQTRKLLLLIGTKIAKKNNFDSFANLRQFFPSADQVGELTIFNVGGNKVRLITAIHYNRDRIYIRDVLTHKEYDSGKWKKQ